MHDSHQHSCLHSHVPNTNENAYLLNSNSRLQSDRKDRPTRNQENTWVRKHLRLHRWDLSGNGKGGPGRCSSKADQQRCTTRWKWRCKRCGAGAQTLPNDQSLPRQLHENPKIAWKVSDVFCNFVVFVWHCSVRVPTSILLLIKGINRISAQLIHGINRLLITLVRYLTTLVGYDPNR